MSGVTYAPTPITLLVVPPGQPTVERQGPLFPALDTKITLCFCTASVITSQILPELGHCLSVLVPGGYTVNPSVMEITHVYAKLRSEFGRQCLFSDRPEEVMVDIHPEPSLASHFILKTRKDQGLQACRDMSEHQVGLRLK
ncbi:hypothetical protein XENOCAPTIV_019171 [Xenoophorus captivus]|uniref:Uncharacterized protein n=1 Tax=Xenoophorus captivus TaxID=1517983 RepID=A0ABV0SHU6_9TELE